MSDAMLLVLFLATLVSASYYRFPDPGPFSAHCMVALTQDTVIMYGGIDFSQNIVNKVHFWNATRNRWKTVQTFGVSPHPKDNPVCFAANATTFYVYGGIWTSSFINAPYQPFDTLDILHVPTLTWSRGASSGVLQGDSCGAYANGIFVSFGGTAEAAVVAIGVVSHCSNITMLYRPASNSWTRLTGGMSLPSLCGCRAAASATSVFMYGGSSVGFGSQSYVPVSNTMWRFDTVSLSWSAIVPSGPTPVPGNWAAFVWNAMLAKFFWFGGEVPPDTPSNGMWSFNGTWHQEPSMPQYTNFMKGICLPGDPLVYWYAGLTSVSSTNLMYAYDPGTQSYSTLNTIVDPLLSLGIQRTLYGADRYQDTWIVWGGCNGNVFTDALNDLAALDLRTMTWRSVVQQGEVMSPRVSPTLTVLGPFAYLYGGLRSTDWTAWGDLMRLDIATWTWHRVVPAPGPAPGNRSDHTTVVWGTMLIVYGGQSCCVNYDDVWTIDPTATLPTWRAPSVTGTVPEQRYDHTACVYGSTMYMYGGSDNGPPLPGLFALDLVSWSWTLVNPHSVSSPPDRLFHSAVVLGAKWYVHGGQNGFGAPLSDTWAYSFTDQTWTQVVHLDPSSNLPALTSQGRGATISPFGDELIIWGPGFPTYATELFSPGYHDISVSPSGSNVQCQLDESQPCADLTFALSRFAGTSDYAFTVAADLRSDFVISGIQPLSNMVLSSPVSIRGSGSGVALDCQHSRCMDAVNVQTDKIVLANLAIRNGNSSDGGALRLVHSRALLQGVSLSYNTAVRGGAISVLAGSTLDMVSVHLVNNKADTQGGALYIAGSSSMTMTGAGSLFSFNVALAAGGALFAVDSILDMANTSFVFNRVQALEQQGLVAGGALGAVDCAVTLSSCTIHGNGIDASADQNTWGGGAFLYSSDTILTDCIVSNNWAKSGGGLASQSVPLSVAQVLSTVIEPSTIVLDKTSFLSNWATQDGGGLYVDSAQAVNLASCRLFNNSALGSGGGVLCVATKVSALASTFDSNRCSKGNGGAVALLATLCSVATSHFDRNMSPMGGGGAVFWGPDSLMQAPIRPQIDRQSVLASTNTAAFGDAIASQAVGIQMVQTTTDATAGGSLNGPLVVAIVDDLNQTVRNANLVVTIQPASGFSGGITVQTSSGMATFSDLVVQAAPNQTVLYWFETAAATNVLKTKSYVLQTRPCTSGSYWHVSSGTCQPCPTGTTSEGLMQTQCTVHLSTTAYWTVLIVALVSALAMGVALPLWIALYYHHSDVLQRLPTTAHALFVGGSLVLVISSLLYVVEPRATPIVCDARIWCTSIGATMISAVFYCKSSLIFTLLKSGEATSAQRMSASLPRQLGLLVSMQVTWLVILSGARLTSVTSLTDGNGNAVRVCSTDSTYATWLAFQIGILGAPILLSAALLAKWWNIPSRYSETGSTLTCLVMLVLAGCILLPLDSDLTVVDTVALERGLGQSLLALSLGIILYGTQAYHILIARSKATIVSYSAHIHKSETQRMISVM